MTCQLIVVSGMPGVGKTAVADQVALRLDAVRLSIDSIEDALLASGLESGWATGVAAYEAAGAAAEDNLKGGHVVVVDAVNDSEPARETWRRAAARAGAPTVWVVLTCSDPAEHSRRLSHRDRGLLHVPEPTWEDVLQRGSICAPWSESTLEVDTAARTVSETAGVVVDLLSLPQP